MQEYKGRVVSVSATVCRAAAGGFILAEAIRSKNMDKLKKKTPGKSNLSEVF